MRRAFGRWDWVVNGVLFTQFRLPTRCLVSEVVVYLAHGSTSPTNQTRYPFRPDRIGVSLTSDRTAEYGRPFGLQTDAHIGTAWL